MAREEQRREGQHRGGERPCVCLSTCVCQNRSSCVDTDGFRGKKIKGEGGGGLLFVLSVVRQPLPPAFCRVH